MIQIDPAMRRRLREIIACAGAGLLAIGCAASPSSSAGATDPSASGAAPGDAFEGEPKLPHIPPGDPFALDGLIREERLPLLSPAAEKIVKIALDAAPPGIPAPPSSCAAYADRPSAAAGACADRRAALELLAGALSEGDSAKSDAKLASLETCAGLPSGVVRALRAELAPPACGDSLVVPFLAQAQATDKLQPAVYHALVGLALSARLDRAAGGAPKLAPPYTKARVSAFVKGPMLEWLDRQANAVEEVAAAGAKLPYYGKAIVAVSAGLADLRLVQAIRDVPIPDDFKNDAELESAYYSSLDVALDPRKVRGRDAALVGLKEMANVGALRDRRVEAARKLLSSLYGGRRVDALDSLLLPDAPVPEGKSLEERLARRLPAFYAGLLLPPASALDEGVLSQMTLQGLSVPHRIALRDAPLSPGIRRLLVRTRVALGRRYWRGVDFDLAAVTAKGWPDDEDRPDEITLLFAVALALRGGPDDVADMMLKAPAGTEGVGNTAALDSITHAGGPLAAMAAYDAAIIRQVGVPNGAAPAYWEDLAERYRLAASLLPPGSHRDDAADRAAAAKATAKEIQRP